MVYKGTPYHPLQHPLEDLYRYVEILKNFFSTRSQNSLLNIEASTHQKKVSFCFLDFREISDPGLSTSN